MKRILWLLTLTAVAFTACQKGGHSGESGGLVIDIPVGTEVDGVRVTDVIVRKADHLTAINIEYPSIDPFGAPATLSGTITIGDKINSDTPARGIALINHYSIYSTEQCASKGNLEFEPSMVSHRLVTVDADYYGFGATESYPQAYCMGMINAQASVDALLAAKKLLPLLKVPFVKGKEDVVLNMGYSQGGQTAIAVAKLIDTQYPDLHITKTYAGGGPYDLVETYKHYIQCDEIELPSALLNVLVMVNQYLDPTLSYEDLFTDNVRGDVEEWILSKKHTVSAINNHFGSHPLSYYLPEGLLSLDSPTGKKMVAALASQHICKDWTPRSDQRFMLYHARHDDGVPVVCTEQLYQYLTEEKGFSARKIDLQIDESKSTTHLSGGAQFLIRVLPQLGLAQ